MYLKLVLMVVVLVLFSFESFAAEVVCRGNNSAKHNGKANTCFNGKNNDSAPEYNKQPADKMKIRSVEPPRKPNQHTPSSKIDQQTVETGKHIQAASRIANPESKKSYDSRNYYGR